MVATNTNSNMLKMTLTVTISPKKEREARNSTFFNPPYELNVRTNVAKEVFKLWRKQKSNDFATNLPHQIITILHQIYYEFAPNSYSDFLWFSTKFITISHQIHYDFAPNSLRCRKTLLLWLLMISHQNCYDFETNQEFIWDKNRPKYT